MSGVSVNLFRDEFYRGGLKDTAAALRFDKHELNELAGLMSAEIHAALSGQKSSLPMLRSYVRRVSRYKPGRYIAVDLGGTNLRIELITIDGDLVKLDKIHNYVVPRSIRTGQKADFYDFLAEKICSGLDRASPYQLGFSFAFPVELVSLSEGHLIQWTKNFSVAGMQGHDVVLPLAEAIRRRGYKNIVLVALSNDTVGTLAYSSFLDPKTSMGMVLGTGTNAALWWEGEARNMEWGAFDRWVLPSGRDLRSSFDAALDSESSHPGRQRLEKMVSGRYLGEIFRRILVHFAREPLAVTRYKISAKELCEIAEDDSANLSLVGEHLGAWGTARGSLDERHFVHELATLILARSAAIVAAATVGCLRALDPEFTAPHTVGIDGSLFTRNAFYPAQLRGKVAELSGDKGAKRIQLLVADDGSGKGCAIIAASVDVDADLP